VINFERLDTAITYAAEHPAEFDMWDWFKETSCGTVACLAGTALIQAGYEPRFSASGRIKLTTVVRTYVDGTYEAGTYEAEAAAVWREGVAYPVAETAAELLGLDEDQADEVFNVGDLGQVIEVRNRWAAERGVPERTWGAS
jgi:hypothetical protein